MQDPAPLSPATAHAGTGPVDTASRTGAALVAVLIFAILSLAAWLEPAVAGHGTHRQLGMPECSWVVWFGRPCMTCGMTTAFAHAANLDFGASFRAQPAGCLLCVLFAAVFWVAAYVAATGSRIGGAAMKLVRAPTVAAGAATLLAAWVYKLITWTS